jgi:hypothetical protein
VGVIEKRSLPKTWATIKKDLEKKYTKIPQNIPNVHKIYKTFPLKDLRK